MEPRIEVPMRRKGLRESLLSVEPLKGASTTYRVEYDSDATHIIVRIPRSIPFADLRVKDEVDDAGKRTQSATLVVTASAKAEADTVVSFDAPTGVLKMPLKPTLNLNFGFVLGQKMFFPKPQAGQHEVPDALMQSA